MERPPVRDPVPRLQQLAPHMRAQIVGLRDGATFEQARRRYGQTVNDLVLKGLGRSTSSRVDDRDRYWSPTREVLGEAMRLGFAENQKLPSARKYLDAHRGRRYSLTTAGKKILDQAEGDLVAFYDELTVAVYRAHPYFRRFIQVLEERPLVCPEITEKQVKVSRRKGKGTEYLVDYANERLEQDASETDQRDRIRGIMVACVRRRFGRDPGRQPTNKELVSALNDAFAEVSAKLRGLPFGATDLRILKNWGMQLRLLDQSRYVPGFEKRNLIWLASDISERPRLKIQRRTYEEYGQKVSEEIVRAYRSQASRADSSFSAPYLPIYQVRAEAAFRCGVMRALVDVVIQRLAEEKIPDADSQLWLHLGLTRQPASEPEYRRGGKLRYEMTLQPREIEGI